MRNIIEIVGGPTDGATVDVGTPFPPDAKVLTPVIGVPVSGKTGKPVDREPRKGDTIAVCVYNPLTGKFYYLNSIAMTTSYALQNYLLEKQNSLRNGTIR